MWCLPASVSHLYTYRFIYMCVYRATFAGNMGLHPGWHRHASMHSLKPCRRDLMPVGSTAPQLHKSPLLSVRAENIVPN